MDQLCIVTTGGTIDKIYFDDKSDFQVGEPQIGRILRGTGRGVPLQRDPDPAQGLAAHQTTPTAS